MPPRKQSVPLDQRQISGLNWRIIIAVCMAIMAGAYAVFNFQNQIKNQAERAYEQSVDNNKILKEIQSERKEDERVNNIRLNAIEIEQREAKIRLTHLESQLYQAEKK